MRNSRSFISLVPKNLINKLFIVRRAQMLQPMWFSNGISDKTCGLLILEAVSLFINICTYKNIYICIFNVVIDWKLNILNSDIKCHFVVPLCWYTNEYRTLMENARENVAIWSTVLSSRNVGTIILGYSLLLLINWCNHAEIMTLESFKVCVASSSADRR